jgi:hypothetical protein
MRDRLWIPADWLAAAFEDSTTSHGPFSLSRSGLACASKGATSAAALCKAGLG